MKHLHLVYIVLALLCATSCNDFLDENPKDSRDKKEILNSMSDLKNNCVLTLYNHIGGYNDSEGLQGTGRGIYDLNTITTDEAIIPTRGGDWYDGGFWQGLFLHKWGVNNKAIQRTWEYLFSTIMLCNTSLKDIDIYKSWHSSANVAPLSAEVRAFRALFYYYTMDLFGRVPLIVTAQTDASHMKQVERSDMFWFIVNELQTVAPLLSTERSNQPGEYYGRITRPVVYFLLAKLALNAEVYTDNNWTDQHYTNGKEISFTIDGQTYNAWEAVIYYTQQLTEMGYELETDYASNFAVINEHSKENIFTIPMDKHTYTNLFIYLLRSRNYSHAAAYGLSGENGTCATLETMQTFGYGTEEPDHRLQQCFYIDEVYDKNGQPIYLEDHKTPLIYKPLDVQLDISGLAVEKTAGARMKKYEVELTGYQDGKLSNNDIVLFRYADALLMQSEAKVRNGENGDTELNKVRKRVGEEFRPATLENILDERKLELVWEGWRRQDLIRFKQFTRSYSSRPMLAHEETGYTTVFPIPLTLIKAYSGMQQNYYY